MEVHIKPAQSDDTDFYDVVIMGGALSGGATATLLLRQNPGIRVLILEKSTKLSRRVGEATVEVSAYFMGRTNRISRSKDCGFGLQTAK
jgi:monoamine oxidase